RRTPLLWMLLSFSMEQTTKTRFDSLLQLAGLSLFLATIEMSIPKPMPFLKLGIANLPLLLFVRQLQFRELLFLVFLKVFCQSLISGSLLSYIAVFSACSSLAGSGAMWLLSRLPAKYFSLLGLSIIGAASSNAAQLWLALSYFFPGTGSLLVPWSLSFGLGSGVLLGIFALRFAHSSRWYQEMRTRFLDVPNSAFQSFQPLSKKDSMVKGKYPESLLRFIFGFLSLSLMFVINKYEPVYLLGELLLFLWLNKQLGYRPWWGSILSLTIILVFFHLLLPTGNLLWQLHLPPYIDFKLTQGALERGFGKAFFLLNLIQISRFAISSDLRLPGRLGHIIREVFGYYEVFLNSPVKFRGKSPFDSLDAILCFVGKGSESSAENGLRPNVNSRYKGRIFLTITRFYLLLPQVFFVAFAKFFPLYYFWSV
ncbi:MAG: Gx transporter family protein, partial [Spirochaetota bacterium]